MPTYHFISGLPRSGSTLLSALLRQNPRFHANMSGPLAGLLGSILERMSAKNEFSVFIDDSQRENIIRVSQLKKSNIKFIIHKNKANWRQ